MYSQAGQDQWVLSKIKQGIYLEIGASHPVNISNTYLLEQNGWTGTSIDIDNQCEQEWHKVRTNPLIIANALTMAFNLPQRIDYLSLDIDPSENTFKALTRLPHVKTRFSLITYEHDHYTHVHNYRSLSRVFLKTLGYKLALPDVEYEGKPFEDWWYDPKIFANG